MDSEFPPDQSFALKPELANIDRVVLLADAASAEVFLRQIFPHFTNCLVASADRAYPVNAALKRAVFEGLEQNYKIRVAIFNLACLNSVSIKSDRILVMDDFLMQDFKRHPAERALSLALSAEKLAFLLDSFFGQWEKMARVGNVSFAYANFQEYSNTKFDWRAELLGVPLANADQERNVSVNAAKENLL